MSVIELLPKVRGEYRENANLAKTTWFGVGGNAEILFRPKDTEDLANFIKNKPKNLNVNVIGVGSNILIRDSGVKGVVIKLGRGFVDIKYENSMLIAGAGSLNFNVATFCKDNSLTGLEFLIGIPGSIGGAIAMNAGAYGNDISAVLVQATAVNPDGEVIILRNEDIGFVYRGNTLEDGWIFTESCFRIEIGEKEEIIRKMQEISIARESSQPVRTKTSGSTFKNPPGKKAWELIDQAGCRGLKIGDAIVSEKHCNFLINLGNATAADIENLGEEVKRRVFDNSGIELIWEIKKIGER